MKKYYIGLVVIGIISVGLFVFVLMQGISGKDDKRTYEASQRIAKDINSYTDKKGTVPTSLSQIGVKDVPTTITYTKKSSKSYEFCETYKSSNDSASFDALGQLAGGGIGVGAEDYGDDYYSDDYKPASLYIDYYHKKGLNCQTIELYDYNSTLKPGSGADIYDFYQDDSYLEDTPQTNDNLQFN